MADLPFLKNKNKAGGGASGPIERESDATHPDKLIEMVADELLSAFERKNHAGFMEALRALVLMIQDEDREQDAASKG